MVRRPGVARRSFYSRKGSLSRCLNPCLQAALMGPEPIGDLLGMPPRKAHPDVRKILPRSFDDRSAHPPKGLPGICEILHGSLEKAQFE
jgi:hypothetical protein